MGYQSKEILTIDKAVVCLMLGTLMVYHLAKTGKLLRSSWVTCGISDKAIWTSALPAVSARQREEGKETE